MPDLSDCPYNKILRIKIIGKDAVGIGGKPKGGVGRLLLLGSQSWGIVKEVEPIEGRNTCGLGWERRRLLQRLFSGPAAARYHAPDLMRNHDDVRVHTMMREANDLGDWCLLLKDSVGATDVGNHEAAIKSVKWEAVCLAGCLTPTTCIEV